MSLFQMTNIITVIIIIIFFMPLLTGLLYPITSNRIQNSLLSILSSLKIVLALILTFRLIPILFSEKGNGFVGFVSKYFPSFGDLFLQYHHDIAAYIIVLFIFLSVTLWVLGILTIPLNRYLIAPLTDRLSAALHPMSGTAKKILSVVWQIPKSVCMVLIFTLLLNFYTNYINNPYTDEYISRSTGYQIVNSNVLRPILSTNAVKQIPVLINDSFQKAAEDFTPANNDNGENPNYWKLPVIKYFNGMTLDEAVQSNSQIDNTAKQIVGKEKDARKKAYLLYEWISENIEYDKDKAEIIVQNPSHVNSGSIVTYAERKGICFDYSCLYVSMCRAVGLKVRFVTGLGYNGAGWGDHAWNQVYLPEEERWGNVDTTFGSSGYDYFDNPDFSESHKYDVVQCEWQQ